MKCLRKFLTFCRNISSKAEDLSKEVLDKEMTCRFIFSEDHFSSEKMVVKYGAFLPAKDGSASIYRISELNHDQVWAIDRDYVSGQRKDGRSSKARADILAGSIRTTGLEVKSDPRPHKRHANIERFPSERSATKLRAQELAKAATLLLKP